MLEVIDFWLKNGKEVSWVGLAKALRGIGKYSQLADALMKKGVPNGGGCKLLAIYIMLLPR